MFTTNETEWAGYKNSDPLADRQEIVENPPVWECSQVVLISPGVARWYQEQGVSLEAMNARVYPSEGGDDGE